MLAYHLLDLDRVSIENIIFCEPGMDAIEISLKMWQIPAPFGD
jgi:hypothetical protein